MPFKIILTFFLTFLFSFSKAQQAAIKGQVIEETTKEPVPFANIRMKKAQYGMTCDENGKFNFLTSVFPDTMIITEIGHKTRFLPILTPPTSSLVLKLETYDLMLDDAVVLVYRDPGKALMKRVIANKGQSDVNRAYDYVRSNYTKTEIDVKNLSFENKKSLFGEIMETYDKFAVDSTEKGILPLYFNESFNHEYHGKTLQTKAVKKIAEKNLGLPTDKLGLKLDRFDMNLDVYDGVIAILKTSFVSPVSALGLTYYRYDILDTLEATNTSTREYIIKFKPNFKNENTFEGTFLIEADTYAIKKLKIETSEGINLNFVDKIAVEQEFEPIQTLSQKPIWVLKNEKNTIDFQSGLDLLGIPIKKDSTSKKLRIIKTFLYANYQVDVDQINAENYTALFPKLKNTEGIFDNSMRLDSLSEHEKSIYLATNSILNNDRYKRSANFATFVASGYWDVNNKFRFGPWSSLFSYNRIEGLRNRVSFWTMEGVSKKWNFNALLAYGWKDQKIKYGVGVKYVPSRAPYRKTEIFYNSDYDNTTEVDDEVDHDNVFTLAMRKNVPNFQVFNEQFKLLQEYDLSSNWSTKVYFNYRAMTPTFNFGFYSPEDLGTLDPVYQKRIDVSEIGFNLRYAHNERTRIFNYDKIRIYSRYPVLNFGFTSGFELGQKTHFNYTKFAIGVSQEINIVPKGTFYYNIKAGKILGTVPYLVMNVSHGNPYFVYSKYAFNNMNPYEFAADRYVSAQFRYSMGGLIFDKIPLLNKLNWRERFIGNMYWGDMTQKNVEYNKLINSPAIVTGKTPYAEAGVGIENIFNVFSIDAIWRISHLDNPNNINLVRFGIYTGVKIVF